MAVSTKWLTVAFLVGIALLFAAYFQNDLSFRIMPRASSIGEACVERSAQQNIQQPGALEGQTLYISCGGFLN
ncbi:MAG: hypothetical protein WC050_00965 [Candidatus Paceibacterota bacterium]